MDIKSLSYSTLLYQLFFSSNVIDKGDYLVIRTPELPFYHWGNFLLFPNAPDPNSLQEWTACFQSEFDKSGCAHLAFVWDSPSGEFGESAAFEEEGYYFQFDEILTAGEAVKPAFFNEQVEVRILESNMDWESRIELNEACSGVCNALEFQKLGEHYRGDTLNGKSIFFGAFMDGRLVGELGVFRGGPKTAIVGLVKTDPDFRRQGICASLLYQSIAIGKDLLDFNEFVMVAEKIGGSASVYKSVGFQVVEHGACLLKLL